MTEVFCDSHFHVGNFYNIEATPFEIQNVVKTLNIRQIAVSSLSACVEDYHKLQQEHFELESLLPGRVISLLWLSPQFIQTKRNDKIFTSGINWKGIKLHGLQHILDNDFLNRTADIARYYSFPILIHTGGSPETDAGVYKDFINHNQKLTFILAHGRPILEAIDILSTYDNVWVDTSFMPFENIMLLIAKGFSNKIVFGSDYPAFKYYYPETDEMDYISSKILELKDVLDENSYASIMYLNFQKIFKCNLD